MGIIASTLDAGVQRLFDGLAVDHARGPRPDRPKLVGMDRALVSSGLPSGSTTRPEQTVAYRHLEDRRGTLDFVVLAVRL